MQSKGNVKPSITNEINTLHARANILWQRSDKVHKGMGWPQVSQRKFPGNFHTLNIILASTLEGQYARLEIVILAVAVNSARIILNLAAGSVMEKSRSGLYALICLIYNPLQ